MDVQIRDRFQSGWDRYFPGAELPFVLYYTDHPRDAAVVRPPAQWRCFLGDLTRVRNGQSLCLAAESIACFGGKRYTGFTTDLMPEFEYFLSYGIEGRMEGERYKQSPELVREFVKNSPVFEAPAKFLVAKRWDRLDALDEPEIAVFFATPDVLSGLFTLANFDETDVQAVIAPFAAGCATIVQYPYRENQSDRPRCVLGMFDVSARPCVPAGTLSFAAPMKKFRRMIDHLDESFLITRSWDTVKKRFARTETR